MRTLQITLCLLPLFALGCRMDPNQALLEQEARRLEDQVYHLQACLEDCHAAREATIRENESLKRELDGQREGGGETTPRRSTAPAGESPRPVLDFFQRPKRGEAPKLEPPTIELPEPSDTPPAVEGAPSETAPPAVEMPGPGDTSKLSDQTATQLVINRRMTGGLDRDGQPGDEGLVLMVEPRDASGNIVKTTGTLSVVAMDPTLEGDASRIARWDFGPDEILQHYRSSTRAEGYRFELPWPAGQPEHRDLRLFVRYTSDEGRRMTVDAPVAVRRASDGPAQSRSLLSDADGKSGGTRKRAPASRVKARSAGLSRGDVSQSEAEEFDEVADNNEPARGEPKREVTAGDDLRQAARPDRPAWKPYR